MEERKNTDLNTEVAEEQKMDGAEKTDANDNAKIPTKLSDFMDNKVHSFVSLSDKYKDIMSSAYTMLFVGIIGIVCVILVLTEIVSLPFNSETAWLFDSVMGGIFIIFIIAGIVSFMHAKQVKLDADAENALIQSILDWADKNLTAESIDRDLDLEQPDELLYFGRADFIKDSIMHQFEEADEALVLELTEQIYQKIYEPESE